MIEKNLPFIGYEYKEITVRSDQASFYLDCYENFGWETDGNFPQNGAARVTTLHMKRNRKMINKVELTRLQRNFEACANEIEALERSKTATASIWALTVGFFGTVFMAGSVFAVTHEPPIYWLCVLLAIPGFAGWIAPYFVFRSQERRKEKAVQPLIEEKIEEIYQLCEKGHNLL